MISRASMNPSKFMFGGSRFLVISLYIMSYCAFTKFEFINCGYLPNF